MRYLVSVVLGVIMALLLFYVMHSLVAGREGFDASQAGGKVVEFVRVRPDEVTQTKDRRVPRKPPPPKKPPPPPKLKVAQQQQPPPTPMDIETPDIDVGFSGSGPYLGSWQAGDPSAEGDVIPIVRIEPQYPREALLKGIQGWVRVRFTIMEDGSVDDPHVVESEPRRLFDRAAIRAILRWKFKPRIVDGKAVRREAEQVIDFKLDNA